MKKPLQSTIEAKPLHLQNYHIFMVFTNKIDIK